MCSDSEEGSYLRLIDFLYHSTLGSRVIKKKKRFRSRRIVSRWFLSRILRAKVDKNNFFIEMCNGSEAGSYLRLIDFCITQL